MFISDKIFAIRREWLNNLNFQKSNCNLTGLMVIFFNIIDEDVLTMFQKLSIFATKSFLVWMLVAAVIGFIFPQHVATLGKWVPYLLGIVMLGMGLTITPNDFKMVFKAPRAVIIGVCLQFSIMPTLAFIIAKSFHLPPDIAVGVILVGCCPGGTSSNVMSYLAKANVALSVSITTVSTLLAPFVTPALIYLFANEWLEVSFLSMLWSVVAISLILAIVVGGSKHQILTTGLLIFLVVILHNVLGYTIGYWLARLLKLDRQDQKAVSIEVGMQNSGLAVSLAALHFNPIAAVPGAVFSFIHNITGPILAKYWSKKL